MKDSLRLGHQASFGYSLMSPQPPLIHNMPQYFSLLQNTTWGITNSSTGNYLQRLH